MTYRVIFLPGARKDALSLPKPVRVRLITRVDSLAENPRPPGSEPLTGDLRGLRKLRIGDYRVAYEVVDNDGTVWVWQIGHRRRFYRDVRRRRG
jgi:mRNA interferase RelE/StbE